MKADTIDIFDVVQDAIAANNDAGSYYIANATLEAIRSAGYVVVPVEPTRRMAAMGQWKISDTFRVTECVKNNMKACEIYRAMIAAADGK